jgi:methionyl-tRNA formyltransferase
MKVVFFGTPDYVLPVLVALHKKFKEKDGTSPITAVVTQKPRPAGRKKELKYSPVDDWAHQRGIPKYYSAVDLLDANLAADLGVVAAYGELVPKSIIKLFPKGILNIHPSMLPKYRGASPLPAAIASGDTETGVTIMQMDEQMDHGPIVTQSKLDIKDNDTAGILIDKAFRQSADVLVDLLPAYFSNKINIKAQNHKKATYTTLLKRDHGFIPFEYLKATLQGGSLQGELKISFFKDFSTKITPKSIHNLIRALDPWPGAWTEVEINGKKKRLKILGSNISENKLVLTDVQLEGKNPVSWEKFTNAYSRMI